MALTDELKALFIDVASKLKGHGREQTQRPRASHLHGPSSQVTRKGWATTRKGRHELESGFACIDAFSARGRKRAEEHLPNLLEDIKAIADEQSQTDPTFKTTRLYTRLTAKEERGDWWQVRLWSDLEGWAQKAGLREI
jgi:hypothetical protein